MRRAARISAGIIFLLVGLAGLVLPIIQGWLCLAIGAVILSRDIPFFARVENYLVSRAPRVGKVLDYLRRKFPILAE